ncbi:hypothetical protein QUF61_02360 [Candidatus Venteria ishoeyi]|uniref:hypothetical protein n=1 Tax=Candidatus Venteria ishoeyi TaxID=1899563 RepID=UPI0025A5B7D1|nr:hypothetical protein [Candidatus Venteria ishoeyi]MDM8545315.1 hypothetical protein [Candidatus Venteria ishoeyi]
MKNNLNYFMILLPMLFAGLVQNAFSYQHGAKICVSGAGNVAANGNYICFMDQCRGLDANNTDSNVFFCLVWMPFQLP